MSVFVERYRRPLGSSNSIIKREAPDTSDKEALQMAVKNINDSIGHHGLVPSLPVYSALRHLGLTFDQPLPSLYMRARAARKVTEELSKAYAERKVKSVLRSQHAPNVQLINETCIGQSVIVH